MNPNHVLITENAEGKYEVSIFPLQWLIGVYEDVMEARYVARARQFNAEFADVAIDIYDHTGETLEVR